MLYVALWQICAMLYIALELLGISITLYYLLRLARINTLNQAS